MLFCVCFWDTAFYLLHIYICLIESCVAADVFSAFLSGMNHVVVTVRFSFQILVKPAQPGSVIAQQYAIHRQSFVPSLLVHPHLRLARNATVRWRVSRIL